MEGEKVVVMVVVEEEEEVTDIVASAHTHIMPTHDSNPHSSTHVPSTPNQLHININDTTDKIPKQASRNRRIASTPRDGGRRAKGETKGAVGGTQEVDEPSHTQ